MRRLDPVSVRPVARSHPLRAALVGPAPHFSAEAIAEGESSLRLFFTAFAGGLVFFGTYLA
ncbi:MAG TPA: hypothetical protein VEZ70_08770 [Allosphingosinicella sp.]|nr:hypothetical protein [Allosphingosinicella sp.]